MTGWNSGTNTITVDKNSTVSASKLLFTNTDAQIEPGTPTIVAGAAAGTGATASIVKGNDQSMQIRILTGSSPVTGTIATINFNYPFAGGYIPSIKFSPANSNAASLNGPSQVFMDTNNTNSFTVTSGSVALTAATIYLFNIEAS